MFSYVYIYIYIVSICFHIYIYIYVYYITYNRKQILLPSSRLSHTWHLLSFSRFSLQGWAAEAWAARRRRCRAMDRPPIHAIHHMIINHTINQL